jgi:hypothetical protein
MKIRAMAENHARWIKYIPNLAGTCGFFLPVADVSAEIQNEKPGE